MPRMARVLIPNCPHHIVQRGHNRNAVFLTDEDYRYYLENLVEWTQKLSIKVHAYCLMTNHVHLILEPTEVTETIFLLMKRLAGRQAAYVNKLERRTGALWEGRYKASPIQRQEYLWMCCLYINLNPVKANMVSRPEDYLWSGYGERAGLCTLRKILAPWSDGTVGPDANKYIPDSYREFVKNGSYDDSNEMIQLAVERSQLTGNARFIDEIERRIGITPHRNKGRKSWAGPPAKRISDQGEY